MHGMQSIAMNRNAPVAAFEASSTNHGAQAVPACDSRNRRVRTLVSAIAAFTIAGLVVFCPGFVRAQAVAVLTQVQSLDASVGVPFGGLIQGADGNLYGATTNYQALLINPDIPTLGTLFKLTRDGSLTVLHQFTGASETYALFPLLQTASGDLYGVTVSSKGGNGEVFKYSAAGAFSVVHSFTGTDGSQPSGALILAKDGNYYGMTSAGGTSDKGVIYRITPAGVFSKLHDFAAGDGEAPVGALVLANDDFLYGAAARDGDQNVGTLFRISTAAKFSKVFSFDGTTIASPIGSLIQGADGFLYGISSDNITNVPATIYKFLVGIAGVPTVVHSFSEAEGLINPYGGQTLLQASDGNFYGSLVSSQGGDFVQSAGGIYQVTPAGAFTIICRFSGTTGGGGGLGTLIQARDGLLYGSSFAFSDGVGDAKAPSINVYSASISPVLTSPASVPAAPGKPFRFQVVATNFPTSYSASGLPPGLALSTSTGLISGTTSAPPGAYPILLGAANGNGVTSAPFSIVVENAPAITSALSATAREGQPFTYQITATNSPTTLSAGGLPAGLSVDASGLISGTPTASGPFTVNLFVSNVAGPGGALLNLVVAPATPVIDLTVSAPQAVAGAGQKGQFVITRTGGDNSALLKVAYKIKGPARNGVDYVTLSGTRKLKPGKGSATIDIVPIGNGGGPGSRAVTLKLVAGDGYLLGAGVKAKVAIIGK